MQHVSISSGRAQLSATIAGDGPALVFLHAGVADRRMWWSQLTAFSGSFFTVAYDRRGYGDTVCRAEPHSALQDLDALLDTLGLDTAVLVGSSDGGRVAIDYALTRPERVDGLVLIAPAISGAPEPEEFPDEIEPLICELETAYDTDGITRVNELEAHAWLDGPAQKAGRVEGVRRELFLDMNRMALSNPDPGPDIEDIQAVELFRELRVPIEIVSGEYDFPHINARNLKLSGQARRAHLTVMKGVAHLPSFEDPAAFNAVLERVLKRIFKLKSA